LFGRPEFTGPGGTDCGQVAEGQGSDQQAGHDLVAHAEHRRTIENVVRQRDGRGQAD
jgi:hypothetical protein